ncbi:MAG: hypothetical protein FWF03_08855 [Defluviitaleaceae bacterium]|nr:hypothetical protein [Defluviitaleaceae bacterium]
MNNIEIALAVVGCFQTLAVAFIGAFFARSSAAQKRSIEKAETRAILRSEESKLSMKLMSACVNLGVATARAMKEGKVNGKIDSSLINAELADGEYHDLIKAIAAKEISLL